MTYIMFSMYFYANVYLTNLNLYCTNFQQETKENIKKSLNVTNNIVPQGYPLLL